MTKTYTEDELANLSDEELMGMAVPPRMAPSSEDTADTSAEDTPDTQEEEEAGDASVGSEADADADTSDDDDEAGDAGGDGSAPAEPATTAPAGEGKQEAPAKAAGDDKQEKPAESKKSEGPSSEDLKAFYDRVMSPIKANGKEIQLQSADEVVRLIQQGANYTKKLQALQPNLKLLKMLENNGLLDEGKLTYLIDLDKKNPAAIQKFIKESGVDPLEIDTSAEPKYTPGNHKVSDSEIAFQSAIDDLLIEDAGKETVVTLNRTWDAESKKALFADPSILRLMHEQRQSGIYQQISDEIERRKILGTLPVGQAFIHTYHAVGKEMQQKGLLVPKQAAASQPSRVVDTRVATRKTVANDDKAKAASPTKSAPKKVVSDFNPLAMSDEDFEKNAALAKRL